MFESLKAILINMVANLMISAKLATLGFLEINLFGNKGNDVIILIMTSTIEFHLVTQIILSMWSCDQRLVTLAFL